MSPVAGRRSVAGPAGSSSAPATPTPVEDEGQKTQEDIGYGDSKRIKAQKPDTILDTTFRMNELIRLTQEHRNHTQRYAPVSGTTAVGGGTSGGRSPSGTSVPGVGRRSSGGSVPGVGNSVPGVGNSASVKTDQSVFPQVPQCDA
jgi:hypothetical protein